jgi:hypothetical protein
VRWHDCRVIRARTAVVVLAAWSVGAATSVGVGLLALSLVDGTFEDGSSRLSTADTAVQDEPAPPPTTSPAASPSRPTAGPRGSASPAPAPARSASTPRQLSSDGGSVVARCYGDYAYLLSWTPAPGYRAHEVMRGPAAVARVEFEGRAGEYHLTIQCVNGVPRLKAEAGTHGDDDDHYGR